MHTRQPGGQILGRHRFRVRLEHLEDEPTGPAETPTLTAQNLLGGRRHAAVAVPDPDAFRPVQRPASVVDAVEVSVAVTVFITVAVSAVTSVGNVGSTPTRSPVVVVVIWTETRDAP